MTRIMLAMLFLLEVFAFVVFLICFIWSENEWFFVKMMASDFIAGLGTFVLLKMIDEND